jgi:hypothetical protein
LLAAYEAVLSRPQKIVSAALLVCGLQNVALAIPGVPALVVGESSLLVSIAFTAILGLWTAGIAGLGIATIEGVLSLIGYQHPLTPQRANAKTPTTEARLTK